jgi:hypothetical protein
MIAPVAYRLDKGPPPDALRRACAAIGIAPIALADEVIE